MTAYGLSVPHEEIKLIKHVDHMGRTIRQVVSDGCFDIYQAEQSPEVKPFHKAKVILSFLALENNKAEFYGAYQVNGFRDFTADDISRLPAYLAHAHQDGEKRIFYELQPLPEFDELRHRLVVQWRSTRGWFQTKDLDVYELLPSVSVLPFPGMQNVILSWSQLCHITKTPREHKDWHSALRSTAGIYRIVDMQTGEAYIGSAYGEDGVWGRWCTYAKTGHGGNKLLKGKDNTQFRWSIVRTLSGSMSARDVINIENIEKEKHGSRVHGLNGN